MTLSIWVPVGYIGALVLSLSLFSSVYRKRSARNALKGSAEPWHPEGHPERDVYQSLVSAAASGTQLPDHLLKAALLGRAMTDVKRIIQMRDDKQALALLMQKGSIADETMARFALAEKELEAEILDVVSEANTFRDGWGQLIFPTASEMVSHKKLKDVYYAIPEQRNKQTALLTSQGKPIPKPTIDLPPLFTPPGTQVKVHAQPGPQGAGIGPAAVAVAGGAAAGVSPAQVQQMIQAQRAAKAQQAMASHNAAAVHGPPRPPTGPAAAAAASPRKHKANGVTASPAKVKSSHQSSAEGDAGAAAAAGGTPPLTPSSKGNSNGNGTANANGAQEVEVRDDASSWTTTSTPATPAPASAARSPASAGLPSFDSLMETDDDDGEADEAGDSADEEGGGSVGVGAGGGGGSSSAGGGGGGPSPGVNRAQRRQKKKKQKKGGKK